MANQKTRLEQFNYYDSKTSLDKKKQIQGQVKQFINKFIITLSQNIQNFKKSQIQKHVQLYLRTYKRQYIQGQVDKNIFKRENFVNQNLKKKKQQLMYKYLTDPKKLIQQQYQRKRKQQLVNLQHSFKLNKTAKMILNQLKQFLMLFKQKFQTSGYQKESELQEYLTFTPNSANVTFLSQDIQNQAVKYIYQAFMDIILLGSHKKKIYKDYQLNLNTDKCDFKLQRKPTPSFQSVISKMKINNLTISNPFQFVNILLQRNENIMINNKNKSGLNSLQLIDDFINNALQLNENDKNQFSKGVFIKVCDEKCPCCRRICAVQQIHDSGHMCLYGHQMRALGGIKYENGQASVVRCEFLQLFAPIKYNNKDMTWQQFKQYWESKTPGSWNFKQDLKTKQKNSDLYQLAWQLAGQQFCKIHQIKFVKYNKMAEQMKISVPTAIHYIFALDDSGSMSIATSLGKNRWQDLMISFKNTINSIKLLKDAEKLIKITVLIQGTNCIIYQQNVQPSKVNVNINPRMGGNNFLDTFTKAHTFIQKYVPTSTVKFIFMTDGGCAYPSQPVHKIKLLQNAYPKKIYYYGIQFCGNVQVMQTIKKQLKGQNIITHTVEQLTQAYREIINRSQ